MRRDHTSSNITRTPSFVDAPPATSTSTCSPFSSTYRPDVRAASGERFGASPRSSTARFSSSMSSMWIREIVTGREQRQAHGDEGTPAISKTRAPQPARMAEELALVAIVPAHPETIPRGNVGADRAPGGAVRPARRAPSGRRRPSLTRFGVIHMDRHAAVRARRYARRSADAPQIPAKNKTSTQGGSRLALLGNSGSKSVSTRGWTP